MAATEADPPLSTAVRAWVLVLVVLAAGGRAVFLALPVNSDTAMFVYAGKLVAEGGRPGIDLLDNKLPSVGLLMSVPYRAIGANWPGYALLGLALSLLGTIFLWRAARDLWGRDAGVVTLVAAAVWLNLTPGVFGPLQLETIQICLAGIAGAGVLRTLRTGDWRDAALAGLCGGLAMWAKPTGGAVLAAGAVAVLCAGRGGWRNRVPALGWLSLGAGLPVAVCAIIVIHTGMTEALPETLRQLRSYSAESTLDGMDVAKPLIVLLLLAFPLIVLGGVFRRHPRTSAAASPDVLFVLLWLSAELAGVVSQRRMYAYHFLVLGPPAALAAGLVARRINAASLTLAFGPAVALTIVFATAWTVRPSDARDDRVIAYLKHRVPASDSVWTDDYPRLLVENGHRPGSSVPLLFLMANGDAAPEYFGRRLLSDWAERRPAYIVFAADRKRLGDLYRYHMADVAASPPRADAMVRQFEQIERFLKTHYVPEADIGSMRVWRRTGASVNSVADVGPVGR